MKTIATVKQAKYDEYDEDCHEYTIVTTEGIELCYYNKNYYEICDVFEIEILGTNGNYVFYKI